MQSPNPFDSRIYISRVCIENFASIRSCDVALGPLSVLTGPNAAGKSNFLKAISFALSNTPIRERVQEFGGMRTLCHRRADGTADSFSIKLTFSRFRLGEPDGTKAEYEIQVGLDDAGRPELRAETLDAVGDWEAASFPVTDKEVLDSIPRHSSAHRESHFHSMLRRSGVSDLDAMATCAQFYDLDTDILRRTDLSLPEDRSEALGERGEHLGHVLGRLAEEYPDVKEEIDNYLSVVIPNAIGIDQKRQGDYSEVQGRFMVQNPSDSATSVESFDHASLSEGTLRLAGILAALNQWCVQQGHIKFLTIEEPEKALHPPKLGVLFEILDAASHMTQVVVSTQSPDLLDNKAAKPKHLLVVENIDGETVIGPMDEVGQSLYDDNLLSLTDLLRYGSMHPSLPDLGDEVSK